MEQYSQYGHQPGQNQYYDGTSPMSFNFGNNHAGSRSGLHIDQYNDVYPSTGAPTFDPIRDPLANAHDCACGPRCICEASSCVCAGGSCFCDPLNDDENTSETPQQQVGQSSDKHSWGTMVERLKSEVALGMKAEVEPLHETIKQLQEEHSRLREETSQLQEERSRQRAEITAARGKLKIPPPIFKPVVAAMLGLLGMSHPKCEVPGPLNAGEPPRVDENGVELFNPTWKGTANGAQPLVIATVKLVISNENAKRTLPASCGDLNKELEVLIALAAVQHFSTKQKAYKAQTDPKYAAAAAHKMFRNRVDNRTKRTATLRRSVIDKLEDKYGPENCVGALALVHADWGSEDGTDAGEADPEEWTASQGASGDPKRGRECCKPEWRSDMLDRFYGVLDTLERQEDVPKKLPVGGKNRPSSGGKDLRKDAFCVDRFRGFPENSLKGPPKKHAPYVSCVNQAWAETHQGEGELVADPPSFTIFKLAIPDSDFDAQALALLGIKIVPEVV
ncbi:hypothetical protein C8R46DRAFT_1212393 [Mycena filopes]|nr:hypothetical protein C8R46DRAFT_1212393 [Mycena filopes]